MKTLIYTLLLTCCTSFTTAQNGIVNIEQDEKIEDLLKVYKTHLANTEYYRIQVGFVSTDTKANNLKALVNIDFPNLSSRIDFESPTYRVKVGRFKNKLEAERKFIEVRKKYPDAMLLKPKKSTK